MLHGDVLGERARLTPERHALTYVPTGVRYTYRELNARAIALATTFRDKLGLEKGDRVAILANNCPAFIEAFFAAIKSGVVLVPIGAKLTPNEIEYILRDAGVRAMIYSGAHAQTVRALDRRVSLEHWIALETPVEGSHLSYEALQDTAVVGGASRYKVESSDLCALLYTSGTTGRPKGVMIPQRMIGWNALNTVACWQLRETDVSSVFTPLYHAGGLAVFIPPLFAVGGAIVLHDGFDADEVLAQIEKESVTVLLGVPTIFRFMLDSSKFDETDLSSMRWFISGGAPLPPALVHEFRKKGFVLRQGYGLTEVGVNCFSMTSEEAVVHAGAIGHPMMFTEAKLVGEAGVTVEPGEVGELCLRGPHVSQGYWNNEKATSEVYDDEGFFHTGDLAKVDEAGVFTIVGRRTDMYISGGVNVYPPEIEAELMLHEGVEDIAVVGVPDPKWGESGVGFVIVRDRSRLDQQALVGFLKGRLARYKIPREFVFVSEFPRTPYGKVQKKELRRRYLEGELGVEN